MKINVDRHDDFYMRLLNDVEIRWNITEEDNDTGIIILYTHCQVSWWSNKKRHRIGNPAAINVDGGEYWYTNGEHQIVSICPVS